jgi:hypothetical protein
VVSDVASRLFGSKVHEGSVITETLKRITPEVSKESILSALKEALREPLPEDLGFDDMRRHPMAVWVELTLGLFWDGTKWGREKPLTVAEAAERLAMDTGADVVACRTYLKRFLLATYNCRDERNQSLFAFRLHQFISGAAQAYTTLEAEGERQITTEGQQFVPSDRARRLFNVHFCRECGQEYYPVWIETDGTVPKSLTPREIDDKRQEEEEIKHGYFTPDDGHLWYPEAPDAFPEAWLDLSSDGACLKSSYKRYAPRSVHVRPDGALTTGDGLAGWLVSGNFRFCLGCGVSYHTAGKESTRLASLSGEGRSSATTNLTLAALRYLFERETDLSPDAKKILGFSDNRQDAALQAGHFNDFMQVLILRSGLLSGIEVSSEGYLTDSNLTQAVYRSLRLDSDDPAIRAEYTNPELKVDAKGAGRSRVEETLRDMLGYRLYFDLRRGWRFGNPNLEQLGILRIQYEDLDKLSADDEVWATAPPMVTAAGPERRSGMLRLILDTMRRGLCIKTRYLDPFQVERLKNESFNNLCDPWAFAEDEQPVTANLFVTGSKPSKRKSRRAHKEAKDLVSGGSRSALARELKKRSLWGDDNPYFSPLSDKTYPDILKALLKGLMRYGMVDEVETDFDMPAYQVNSACLQWYLMPEGEEALPIGSLASDNLFFRALYRNVASVLANPSHLLYRIKAAEHTRTGGR